MVDHFKDSLQAKMVLFLYRLGYNLLCRCFLTLFDKYDLLVYSRPKVENSIMNVHTPMHFLKNFFLSKVGLFLVEFILMVVRNAIVILQSHYSTCFRLNLILFGLRKARLLSQNLRYRWDLVPF
jgi:hypothetical protein